MRLSKNEASAPGPHRAMAVRRMTPAAVRPATALLAVVVVAIAMLSATGCAGNDDATTAASAATSTTAIATTTTTAATTTPTESSDPPAGDDLIGADLVALLAPEDVQDASGFAEVRRAGRNPDRRLGGDLNFVLPDGRPLLMVVVQPAYSFDEWKADPDSYREDLEGLGETAFVGPAVAMNEAPYLLVFRSGERTVGLLTYDDPDVDGWNNLLTLEQLQALARVIVGRL